MTKTNAIFAAIAAISLSTLLAWGQNLGVSGAYYLETSTVPTQTCSASSFNGVFAVDSNQVEYQCSANNTAHTFTWNVIGGNGGSGLPSGVTSPGSGDLTLTGTLIDAGETINSTSTIPLSILNSAMANGTSIEIMIGDAATGSNSAILGFTKVATGSPSNTVFLGLDGDHNMSISGSGNVVIQAGLTVGTTLSATGEVSGNGVVNVSARRGTFVCSSSVSPVSNTNVIVGSDITFTPETISGTITTAPVITSLTAGTGFSVSCGSGDTSTYRYTVWN